MILIGLPVTVHASGGNLRLQTLNGMPQGTKMNFKVSFPRGAEFESFRIEAEIVWRDVYFWEDWKGYQYALGLADILTGQYLRLRQGLRRLGGMEETPVQINRRGIFP